MLITLITKCGDCPQLWTFDIEENDSIEIMEKYGHRGESVLIDADDLPHDIREYYNEKQ